MASIFPAMRYATRLALALALVVACKERRDASDAPGDSLDLSTFADLGSGDSGRAAADTPVVVTRASVIVFWLPAADTLHPDEAAAAFDELSTATEAIAPELAAYEIPLYATHADTVYVELPNRRRRSILLSGLEFPFGYLFVEPGGVERILTGVYAEDELLEEVRAYFDLPADSLAPSVKT